MSSKVLVYADKLKGMQKEAAKAMENYTPGGGFSTVPSGVYNARETCELTETRADGLLRISRKFTITEGEQEGLNAFDGLQLQIKNKESGEIVINDVGLQIAREWIEKHGETWPEDISEIEEIINRINAAAPLVEIFVQEPKAGKNGRMFQNINVNKVLEATSEAASESAPETQVNENPAPESTDSDDLDSLSRAELKAMILEKELDIPVTSKMTDDDIRTAIRENTPANETPSADDTKDLLVFCASQSVDDVNDQMTKDEIVGVMSGYKFNRWEITDDENAMLEDCGLSGNIVRKKPVTPVTKPAAAKKPVVQAKKKGK
jgi:hypothetical protein